jgi:AbrB family looped-hinge helix DNA binding protein
MASPVQFNTIVSTKGQVILPKAIRDQLRWDSGTRLIVESHADGVLLKPETVFASSRAKDVFGSLPRRGGAKTVTEMNLQTGNDMKQRDARDR